MPPRAAQRLTDKLVRALERPAQGARITYDGDVPGFGIRITANGVRAFILNYVVAGRERRLTIGQFPIWSASAAREEARTLKRAVNLGVDPLEHRAAARTAAEAERQAPTMQHLFERYAAEHLPRKAPRSASDDRAMWQQIVLPRLGRLMVADVTAADIDALHAEVSATRPVRANRVIEVVRKAFNLAIRWGWRQDNPAAGVHRNREERRERYLSPPEILRLAKALLEHPERTSANAIRLLMLTGARRSEVLAATWDHFDLAAGVWTKPSAHTKQRKKHRVPLSAPARQLLADMRAGSSSEFLFPAKSGARPITDVKRTWLAVCKAADLAKQEGVRDIGAARSFGTRGQAWRTTVRLHDLRHTYASLLASEGLSLPIIGALLGHTQPQTTARYAHLLDDPLREAAERVGAIVAGDASGEMVHPQPRARR